MEISEIKKKKIELEEKIFEMVSELEEQSGVTVEDIHVRHILPLGENRRSKITDIKLEVMIY